MYRDHRLRSPILLTDSLHPRFKTARDNHTTDRISGRPRASCSSQGEHHLARVERLGEPLRRIALNAPQPG